MNTPMFFLSYASISPKHNRRVEKFFSDLVEAVRDINTLKTGNVHDEDIGFCAVRLSAGTIWPPELCQKLNSCRVLVCLYSDAYFRSPQCGKEFEIFQNRLNEYIRDKGVSSPALIIPVLWVIDPAFNERFLPSALKPIHYKFSGFEDVTNQGGIYYYLAIHANNRTKYDEYVINLARTITRAANHSPALPPLANDFDFETTVNAFADYSGPPTEPEKGLVDSGDVQTKPAQIDLSAEAISLTKIKLRWKTDASINVMIERRPEAKGEFRSIVISVQLSMSIQIISNSFTIARTFFESTAKSRFNSLQFEFRKRYSRGFLIGSAFTYSHSVDDASDFFDNAGAFSLPQNSINRSERGSSNYDVRIRSATYFVLDVQREWIGRKSWEDRKIGWLRTVLGNLQVAGIFTAQGGQPYTVNSSIDVNRDGNLTDRLNTVQGLITESTNNRVQLQLDPNVNAHDLLAADGFDGAIGRNTFRAGQVYNFDLAVTGAIPVEGNRRFLIRAEFLNFFNFANYGIPDRILESPGFGTSLSTLVQPRMIQFVGKFQF